MSDEKSLKYNEPWILQRADPYVYRHTDGSYYFTASVPAYDGIVLRRAGTLAELSGAEEIRLQDLRQQLRLKSGTSMRADRRAYIYGHRSFIICLENGIFILREARRKISGRSVHMC